MKPNKLHDFLVALQSYRIEFCRNVIRSTKRSIQLMVIAMLALSVTAFNASALTVDFSLTDDPGTNPFGRVHLGGTLTGTLYGLSADGVDQSITGIEFTSGFADLGVSAGIFDVPAGAF